MFLADYTPSQAFAPISPVEDSAYRSGDECSVVLVCGRTENERGDGLEDSGCTAHIVGRPLSMFPGPDARAADLIPVCILVFCCYGCWRVHGHCISASLWKSVALHPPLSFRIAGPSPPVLLRCHEKVHRRLVLFVSQGAAGIWVQTKGLVSDGENVKAWRNGGRTGAQ